MKDTFIYRFIDISVTLLDLVMENQSVADHYMTWIDDQENILDGGEDAQITPLALSELRNASGSHILILALPTGGQFLVIFQAGAFNAKIIIAQDQETAILQAASVTEFTGDLHYAINWGKDFLDRIDEDMIAAGM
nr:K775 [uncultured bacterium]